MPGRVETILGGWWRIGDDKFHRCRTMDVSLDGGLIVVESPLEIGQKVELHLDVDTELSIHLEAQVLSQRPIFFGKQFLTGVTYQFLKASDRSMFGLWIQRQLASEIVDGKSYLQPARPNPERQGVDPGFGSSLRLTYPESPWKLLVSRFTAMIPWVETEGLPDERRAEHRGQVGMELTLDVDGRSFPCELLNVSLSGAALFLRTTTLTEISKGENWPGTGRTSQGNLVVPRDSLLIGGRRCGVKVVWRLAAETVSEGSDTGRAYGLQFVEPPTKVRKTFVGDLLRRIDYDPRQVRSELRFPVTISVTLVEDGQSQEIAGKTVDLGVGGALVSFSEPVKVPGGGIMTLVLPRAGAESVSLTMSVRVLRQTKSSETADEASTSAIYGLAFRKGQGEARLKLSRWLTGRMRVQTLQELFPDMPGTARGL